MKLLSALTLVINEQFRPVPEDGNNNPSTNNGEGKSFISPLGYTASVNSPYQLVRWGKPHKGIDLQASEGTALRSPAPGTVLAAGGCSTCGNSVTINHGNINGKEVITRYCHMSSIDVKVGDTLTQGQVFGKTGNTGKSDGAHLHFEIRENDMFVNPLNYIGSFVTVGTDGKGDNSKMPIGKSYCSGSSPTMGGEGDEIPDSKVDDILPAGLDWEKLKEKLPSLDIEELKKLKMMGGDSWLKMVDTITKAAGDELKKNTSFYEKKPYWFEKNKDK